MNVVVALTVLVAAASLSACSSAADTSDAGAVRDASTDHADVDVGRDGPEDAPEDVPVLPYEAAPPPSLAGVRFANWSTEAAPVDFCLAPHGTTKWRGPLLAVANRADDGGSAPGALGLTGGDGGVSGLGYPGVTSYFDVSPGQYDARFVAAGAADCTVPIVAPSAQGLPVLAKGGIATVALLSQAQMDAGASGLEVVAFVDDLDVPPASAVGKDHVGVRFINAAPAVASADFGTGQPGVFMGDYVPMFSGVAYGQSGNSSETTLVPPYIDKNGYAFTSALLYAPPPMGLLFGPSSFSASVVQNQTSLTLAIGSTSVAGGAIVTVVLISASTDFDAGDGGSSGEGAFQLLQCIDNGGSAGSGGDCSLL